MEEEEVIPCYQGSLFSILNVYPIFAAMKKSAWLRKVMLLEGMIICLAGLIFAQEEKDSLIHQFGMEFRPGFITQSHPFFRGENENLRPIRNSFSAHLKYSFKFQPNTITGKIYGGVYQGLGLAYYTFGEHKQLGDPILLYLFQGARLARFSDKLSLNYEWNFGLSFGWHPHDFETNHFNRVIGSKANAYINTNFYLSWMLSRQVDLTTGVALTHFSNGNTKFPNAGLNTIGPKVGLVYNFNRTDNFIPKRSYDPSLPEFHRHVSYDLVLFGSWRRKGVYVGDGYQIPSPDTYGVMGFNFSPMYNFGYRFRAGVSLDGVYDRSANIYLNDYSTYSEEEFLRPSFSKQTALGLSGRAEYIMPYFTIGLGLGANLLHAHGDLKAVYQILALKIELTRNSFLHIGYSLQDFHDPNFLMLGIGYRFKKY